MEPEQAARADTPRDRLGVQLELPRRNHAVLASGQLDQLSIRLS
jgi:hypothetical protein